MKYGADYEARTRYLHLGKVALYRMSYARISKRYCITKLILVNCFLSGLAKNRKMKYTFFNFENRRMYLWKSTTF